MKLFGDTIDYVAVFDSDFQPSPSFLRDLVPYLVANPTVGWVQVGAAYAVGGVSSVPTQLVYQQGVSGSLLRVLTLLLGCRAAGSSRTPTSHT